VGVFVVVVGGGGGGWGKLITSGIRKTSLLEARDQDKEEGSIKFLWEGRR